MKEIELLKQVMGIWTSNASNVQFYVQGIRFPIHQTSNQTFKVVLANLSNGECNRIIDWDYLWDNFTHTMKI